MKRHKYLPFFVAFITGWAAFNIWSSLHYHRGIGFVDLFFLVIGLIYFGDCIRLFIRKSK